VLFPDVNLPKEFAPVISLVFAIGMLGLVDDALTLGAKTKFGIMLLISGAAVWLIGAPTKLPLLNGTLTLLPVAGYVGALLWVFVVMNAVNFMDGANGMMGLSLTIANIGLFGAGLIGGSATTLLLSGLSLMTILGFLPYNVRQKARIFSGDVGSLTLSFLFAVSVLYLIKETPEQTLVLVGPILILPILADVLLTLIRRARNRDNLLQAHNTHLYQRLIQRGINHLTVSWFYALAGLLCANIVVFGAPRGWLASLHIPLMLLGGVVAIYLIINLSLKDRTLANSRNNKSG
jgi:UDP-N-acetylmuramyl pentapeptide phosphotransferase/UDP-N-acetylglucosamine-1-phosphate transferase